MRVVVSPYDTEWPRLFRKEALRIAPAFGPELITIHHIGSTSIPDLAAKPVIDMMPVVRRIETVDGETTRWLARLGYEGLGEFGLPGRRYFRKGGARRTHQLHAYAFDNPETLRHLAFRDYLRVRPGVRDAYGALKTGLAASFSRDIEGYMDGKDHFIKETEALALAWWRRLPCLFLNGTVGVGKTTTLEAVAAMLDAQNVPYLAVDLDGLGQTNQKSPHDPFSRGLSLANLEAMVQRGRALGIRVVVLAGVIEGAEEREAFRAAMGGAEVFLVRLQAPDPVVEKRLRQRMVPGPALDWHLERRGELHQILERAGLDDAVVDAASKSPELVAGEILDRWNLSAIID